MFRIYTIILTHLRAHPDYLTQHRSYPAEAAEEVAARVLERVKIMRVFDLEGLVEGIEEVRDGLVGERDEGAGKANLDGDNAMAVAHNDDGVKDKALPPQSSARTVVYDSEDSASEEAEANIQIPPPQSSGRKVVYDSEDEEDEDDMLFDSGPPGPDISTPAVEQQHTKPPSPTEPPPSSLLPSANQHHTNPPQPTPSKPQTSFLLIDNIAHTMHPVLKSNYIHGTYLTMQTL